MILMVESVAPRGDDLATTWPNSFAVMAMFRSSTANYLQPKTSDHRTSLLMDLRASRAFSSEVDTGSREENASKQKDRVRS
jgi:hypothetical protein